MDSSIQEELMAYAIGSAVLRWLENDEIKKQLIADTESRAVRALEQIREALNDDTLDNQTCFLRMEAIVDAYAENHIATDRHDW